MPGDSLSPGRSSKARRSEANARRFLQPGETRLASPSERWQLIVRGRVQGVGYRAACCSRARELGLGGWVRNRADGSVEVQAEGPASDLAELRLWCERGPAVAQVTGVAVTTLGSTGQDWFEIHA
ncbi:MAG: acylphosphatase [Cyanobium sp. M30B3]|jgi:acylphosphatase|nr:MAG: acylphosphatase [Cyanobium sp. M30B3]